MTVQSHKRCRWLGSLIIYEGFWEYHQTNFCDNHEPWSSRKIWEHDVGTPFGLQRVLGRSYESSRSSTSVRVWGFGGQEWPKLGANETPLCCTHFSKVGYERLTSCKKTIFCLFAIQLFSNWANEQTSSIHTCCSTRVPTSNCASMVRGRSSFDCSHCFQLAARPQMWRHQRCAVSTKRPCLRQ